jgi:EAL domain-containing protein (putative c-di-GMP-specific phosphodiesterase class I)
VVEGVETLDQLELLRAMGGTLAQGFIFSRAVEREEAAELLRKHGLGVAEGTALPLKPAVPTTPNLRVA